MVAGDPWVRSSPAFTMTVCQRVVHGMEADAARLFAAAIDKSDDEDRTHDRARSVRSE
jgi:hypothetical protein